MCLQICHYVVLSFFSSETTGLFVDRTWVRLSLNVKMLPMIAAISKYWNFHQMIKNFTFNFCLILKKSFKIVILREWKGIPRFVEENLYVFSEFNLTALFSIKVDLITKRESGRSGSYCLILPHFCACPQLQPRILSTFVFFFPF